jgi:hypothetical protein
MVLIVVPWDVIQAGTMPDELMGYITEDIWGKVIARLKVRVCLRVYYKIGTVILGRSGAGCGQPE